jgi:prophage regulatory protein
MPVKKFLRRRAVEMAVGLKHSAIYELMGDGLFPKPVQISPGAVAWVEDEIAEWQQQRVAERDKPRKRER